MDDKSVAWNEAILDYVKKEKIPKFLLACRWQSYAAGGESSNGNTFIDGLLQTVSALQDAGCEVLIFLEVPNHKAAVPKMLALNRAHGVKIEQYRGNSDYCRERIYPEFLAELKSKNVRVIDASPMLLDSEVNLFRVEYQDKALYYESALNPRWSDLYQVYFQRLV